MRAWIPPISPPALTAHSRAWEAYCARISDHEKAKANYNDAYFVHDPGSHEVREAQGKVDSARRAVTAAKDSLRAAARALLAIARTLAQEANTLRETAMTEARAKWEKHSFGAKLYDTRLREADFAASPWRQAMPVFYSFQEYPAAIEQLPDIGPEFSARVSATAAIVAQNRAGLETLRAFKV